MIKNMIWKMPNQPKKAARSRRGKRKFRIELGSLVTTLMKRTYTVSADSEEEAIEKARERFRRACENSKVYKDCDSTIEVDSVTDIT